jgi:lipopolysaccharide export system protein LptA
MRFPLLGRLSLGLLIAAAGASSADAQAPTGQCNILENERVDRRLEAGVPMIYVTGPFLIRCPGGEELRALAGTVNEWTREILLTGNVFFQDPTRTLTANQATYWANLGRLYATGNVVFTDRQEGSTIRGPELEYFRVMEGRPEAQVNAAQRPHLTLRPRQAAANAEPLEIDADRVSIAGQNNLSAYGNVIIRRTDLHATAEEALYNSATDALDLRQNARIQSEQFNLSGRTVHARLPAGALEYVHARTDATLVGDELRVEAPDLQLFFSEDLLHRAVARTEVDPAGNRTGRAVATARAFRLEGDSIDAVTPNQRVDQVIAIGRARGESIEEAPLDAPEPAPRAESPDRPVTPDVADRDTLGPVLASSLIDRDWIVGDTITGFFEYEEAAGATEAAADTGAVLRRIVARGMAQSLYRVEQEAGASPGQRRGINYLAGQLIELSFESGELQVAEVTGLRRGVYLDPVPAGQPAPVDPTPVAQPIARRGGS